MDVFHHFKKSHEKSEFSLRKLHIYSCFIYRIGGATKELRIPCSKRFLFNPRENKMTKMNRQFQIIKS